LPLSSDHLREIKHKISRVLKGGEKMLNEWTDRPAPKRTNWIKLVRDVVSLAAMGLVIYSAVLKATK
jgi:hypothetical protein